MWSSSWVLTEENPNSNTAHLGRWESAFGMWIWGYYPRKTMEETQGQTNCTERKCVKEATWSCETTGKTWHSHTWNTSLSSSKRQLLPMLDEAGGSSLPDKTTELIRCWGWPQEDKQTIVYYAASHTLTVREKLLLSSHPQRAVKNAAFGAQWIGKRSHKRRKDKGQNQSQSGWVLGRFEGQIHHTSAVQESWAVKLKYTNLVRHLCAMQCAPTHQTLIRRRHCHPRPRGIPQIILRAVSSTQSKKVNHTRAQECNNHDNLINCYRRLKQTWVDYRYWSYQI